MTHLLDLITNLPPDEFETLLIAPGSNRLDGLESAGVNHIAVDVSDDLSPAGDLRTLARYRRALGSFKPDILHIHGNKAALVGRVAAWGLPIPVKIVTVHNVLKFLSEPGFKKRASSAVERLLARRTDLVISVSHDLARDLTEVEGIPETKVRVVHNGVNVGSLSVADGTRQRVRQELGIGGSDVVAAMIARLAPQKAPHVFLEAAKAVSEQSRVRFLMAGDGPSAEQVTRLIDKLSFGDRLIRVGFRSDVAELLAAVDIFVLSSVWEGVPYILGEAMAAGKAIVATDVGGVAELVEDGKSGLLVPSGDSRALGEAIIKVGCDRSLAAQLGRAARHRIERGFTVERMVGETVHIYRDLVQAKKGDRVAV